MGEYYLANLSPHIYLERPCFSRNFGVYIFSEWGKTGSLIINKLVVDLYFATRKPTLYLRNSNNAKRKGIAFWFSTWFILFQVMKTLAKVLTIAIGLACVVEVVVSLHFILFIAIITGDSLDSFLQFYAFDHGWILSNRIVFWKKSNRCLAFCT